jgi:hypothetical protein
MNWVSAWFVCVAKGIIMIMEFEPNISTKIAIFKGRKVRKVILQNVVGSNSFSLTPKP